MRGIDQRPSFHVCRSCLALAQTELAAVHRREPSVAPALPPRSCLVHARCAHRSRPQARARWPRAQESAASSWLAQGTRRQDAVVSWFDRARPRLRRRLTPATRRTPWPPRQPQPRRWNGCLFTRRRACDGGGCCSTHAGLQRSPVALAGAHAGGPCAALRRCSCAAAAAVAAAEAAAPVQPGTPQAQSRRRPHAWPCPTCQAMQVSFHSDQPPHPVSAPALLGATAAAAAAGSRHGSARRMQACMHAPGPCTVSSLLSGNAASVAAMHLAPALPEQAHHHGWHDRHCS